MKNGLRVLINEEIIFVSTFNKNAFNHIFGLNIKEGKKNEVVKHFHLMF